MLRSRTYLWLLLALTLPVQGIAAVAPRLACLDAAAGTAVTAAAATMHCHGTQSADPARPPPCCGDHCPDMAACAVTPAVSAPSLVLPAPEQRIALDDRYRLPESVSRLSSPFRPPAISRV